ncbi:MAG: hypothetical protein Kow0081_1360 [Candidatus Dojkabacteria bacterium]
MNILKNRKLIFVILSIVFLFILGVYIFWINNEDSLSDISVSDSACTYLDSNRDGVISLPDFQNFAFVWGKNCSSSANIPIDSCGLQDSNDNGKIDTFDFINFASNWRKECSPTSGNLSPEPSYCNPECQSGQYCKKDGDNYICQDIPPAFCDPKCSNDETCVRPYPDQPQVAVCSKLIGSHSCDQFEKQCEQQGKICHKIQGSTYYQCLSPGSTLQNAICDSEITCAEGLECKKTLNVNTGELNNVAYCINGLRGSICDENNPCLDNSKCIKVKNLKTNVFSNNRHCSIGAKGDYCGEEISCKDGLTCTEDTSGWPTCK